MCRTRVKADPWLPESVCFIGSGVTIAIISNPNKTPMATTKNFKYYECDIFGHKVSECPKKKRTLVLITNRMGEAGEAVEDQALITRVMVPPEMNGIPL